MITELYESKSLGEEDDQDSQTSEGDWAREQGRNGIILTVFRGRCVRGLIPAGPLGGMWP